MLLANKYKILIILILLSPISWSNEKNQKNSDIIYAHDSVNSSVISDTELNNPHLTSNGNSYKTRRYKNKKYLYTAQQSKNQTSTSENLSQYAQVNKGYYDYLLRKNNINRTSMNQSNTNETDSSNVGKIKFGFATMGTTEVHAADGEKQTPKIEYVLSPRYLFSENYSVGFRIAGEYNLYDEYKNTAAEGYFHLNRESFDLNRSFSFAPSLLLYVPVNAEQTQDKSYKYGFGTKLVLNNTEKASFNDYFKIQFHMILSKGYHEYKTIYSEDPTAAEKYNVNYTFQEGFNPEFHIYSRFWLYWSNVFIQSVDYSNTTKSIFVADTFLKTIINDNIEFYAGIETSDKMYDDNKQINYKLYDTQPGNSRWQLGIMGGF